MRVVTFSANGMSRAGVVVGDGVAALAELVAGAPEDVLGFLEAGPALWDRVRDAAQRARPATRLASVKLLAPIPRPRRNVFAVGWNYLEHFEESREARAGGPAPQKLPDSPEFFSKNPATVVGPDAPVRHPAPHSTQMDWEVELAVVVGRAGVDIPEERALEHVFGYTVGNDVSVRDWQKVGQGRQWFKGKNFDTHCPLGPWIVSADEVGDPHALRICSRVNGTTKQDSSTKFLYFKVPQLIRHLSAGTRLEPGDVIMTGTPPGVGHFRKPPEYLTVGDVMEMEIEKIGVLRNRVEGRT